MEDITVAQYVRYIRKNDMLEGELKRVQSILVLLAKKTLKENEYFNVHKYTQLFQALLAEKARQEVTYEVGNHNSS